jgi:subtilisin family serine protease
MSFSSYSASLQAAIDYAWAQGAVLVAAAGNDDRPNRSIRRATAVSSASQAPTSVILSPQPRTTARPRSWAPVLTSTRFASGIPRRHALPSTAFPERVEATRRDAPTIGAVTARVTGLTGATLVTAPTVCHNCVWWQTRHDGVANKRRWIEKAEDEWGAWGAVYYDDDGRTLGSMQYGPAALFPRGRELPAGPASDDAVLITCAYLVDATKPWVLQSLFLSAIGDARDQRADALETFAYRYPADEPPRERFQVHKTVFPRDFLADFGFRTVRTAGRVELVRLELGGLQPVVEGKRAKVMRVVKEAFQPAPVPQRP